MPIENILNINVYLFDTKKKLICDSTIIFYLVNIFRTQILLYISAFLYYYDTLLKQLFIQI